MRIGIMSDTHGSAEQALEIIPRMGKIDLLIHLGDYIEDSLILKTKFKELKILSIRGNCDRNSPGDDEIVYQLESYKLFAVHGHQYGVKSNLNKLYYRALELGCNIALYGHTHVPVNIKYEDMLIMNPGSLGCPRGGSKATYGIIELEEKGAFGEIIQI